MTANDAFNQFITKLKQAANAGNIKAKDKLRAIRKLYKRAKNGDQTALQKIKELRNRVTEKAAQKTAKPPVTEYRRPEANTGSPFMTPEEYKAHQESQRQAWDKYNKAVEALPSDAPVSEFMKLMREHWPFSGNTDW